MDKKQKELVELIEQQKVDMGSNKVILPKPKRRRMTKQDHAKWDKMKDRRGRL